MLTNVIHYCRRVSVEHPNSFAECGRLVPNEQVYTEENGAVVSCKQCLAVIAKQDRQELAKRVRRYG